METSTSSPLRRSACELRQSRAGRHPLENSLCRRSSRPFADKKDVLRFRPRRQECRKVLCCERPRRNHIGQSASGKSDPLFLTTRCPQVTPPNRRDSRDLVSLHISQNYPMRSLEMLRSPGRPALATSARLRRMNPAFSRTRGSCLPPIVPPSTRDCRWTDLHRRRGRSGAHRFEIGYADSCAPVTP